MKTVFDSRQCVHVWAQQTQAEGRNSGRSIFFAGKSIYSYGRHFEMARFVRPNVVLVTCRKYSVTTAKHLSYVRRSINQYDSFEVPSFTDHATNVQYLIEQAQASFDKAKRARKYGDGQIAWGKRQVQTVRAYLKTFPEASIPSAVVDVWQALHTDTYVGGELQAEIVRKAREAQAKQWEEDRHRAELAKLAESEALEKWKAGEAVYRYFTVTALRVNGNQVETSRGAKVPILEARKLYRAYKAGVLCEGMRVGYYTFNRIEGDCMMIGCHCIPLAEIERIAPQVMAYVEPMCEHCGQAKCAPNCFALTEART